MGSTDTAASWKNTAGVFSAGEAGRIYIPLNATLQKGHVKKVKMSHFRMI